MPDLRLAPLNAETIVAANSLTLKPGQEQYAVPVTHQEAEGTINPTTSWNQVVLEDGEVVGFIVGNLDPAETRPEFRSCVWRVTVRADLQGTGVGRFAILALADEARRRGFERLTVVWEHGAAGPEEFFLHMGFQPIGETRFGETLGALPL